MLEPCLLQPRFHVAGSYGAGAYAGARPPHAARSTYVTIAVACMYVSMCLCIYVYVCIYIYIYIYIFVYMYICIYVSMHACMHARMHVCM